MQQSNSDRTPPSASAAGRYDAKEILSIIIRRRWLILAIVVPIILAAFIGTLRTTSSVTASTLVMVEPRQPENPTLGGGSINDDVVMSTAAQLAMSIPVAEKAAAALIDSIPGLAENDMSMQGLDSEVDLMGALLDGVDCRQREESNVLQITYSHQNERFSLLAVGALTTAFIDYNIERRQNPRAINYYTEQIRSVQTEVDSLMTDRAVVLNSAGISAFTDNPTASVNQIRFLEQEYFRARSNRLGVEARLNQLEKVIIEDPEFVPRDDNLRGLKNTYEGRLAKLADLKSRYNEGAPQIESQKELIASARVDLDRGRRDHVEWLSLQLEESRSIEEALREAVELQQAGLNDYPEVARKVDSLNLQIKNRQELLGSLQFKRGEVRLKSGSDLRISNIIRLNDPSIESVVAGSKKVLYLGLAVFFGLALGLICAMLVDNQDHRVYSPRQVEQYLDTPVLGAVSSGKKGD